MLLIALLLACKPPPPAPEGLDASTLYLVEHFYDDDAMFGAGVQGFMDWFHEEGFELVGEQATADNTDAFTIGNLTDAAIDAMPLDDEILLDKDQDEWGPRDLSAARGVVSLAMMQCRWTEAEALLARPDQHNVFPDDFEGYEREYLGDRDAFEAASASGEYDPIDEPLDPFADGFDPGPYERSLLQTLNSVDPTAVLTADIDPYPMHLDLRHGAFAVDDEDLGVLAILTWINGAAWGSSGEAALLQSYSVEINVEQGDETLRVLAVWAEAKGAGADSDYALTYAVNKSLSASERMSAVCAGEADVPPEE